MHLIPDQPMNIVFPDKTVGEIVSVLVNTLDQV